MPSTINEWGDTAIESPLDWGDVLSEEPTESSGSPEVTAAIQSRLSAPSRPSLSPVFSGSQIGPLSTGRIPVGAPSYEQAVSPGEFSGISPEQLDKINQQAKQQFFQSVFGPEASKWWGDQTQENLESLGKYLKGKSAGAEAIRRTFPEITTILENEQFPKIAGGLASSVVGLGEFATSPAGFYTEALSSVPGAPRLVSALFLADTLKNAPEAGTELGDAVSKNDWRRATEIIANTAGVGALTGHGTFRGGVKGIREYVSKLINPPRVTPPPGLAKIIEEQNRLEDVSRLREVPPVSEIPTIIPRGAGEPGMPIQPPAGMEIVPEPTPELARGGIPATESMLDILPPEDIIRFRNVPVSAPSPIPFIQDPRYPGLTARQSSGMELIREPPVEIAQGGIPANEGMLNILPPPNIEYPAINELLRQRERGPATRRVEETGQSLRRFEDFPRAQAERTSEQVRTQVGEGVAAEVHAEKPLTENQLRIIQDSLRNAVDQNRFSEERKGVIAGTRLEAWADRTLNTPGVHNAPEALAAYAVKGAAVIERGIINAVEWTAEMIRQFPELKDWAKENINKIKEQAERLRKGEYAIQEQKAGEVHGRLSEQPGVNEGEVSSKEGSAGVPSGVQGKAEAGGAEVSVRPPHRVEPPEELKPLFDREGVIYIGKIEPYDLGGGKKTAEYYSAEIYNPLDPSAIPANINFSTKLSHAEISKKIAEKREAFGWKRPDEVGATTEKHVKPQDDWRVVVSAARGEDPGYVQIVDPRATEGSGKITLPEGSPDFSKLPSGRYTYAEAVKKVKSSSLIYEAMVAEKSEQRQDKWSLKDTNVPHRKSVVDVSGRVLGNVSQSPKGGWRVVGDFSLEKFPSAESAAVSLIRDLYPSLIDKLESLKIKGKGQVGANPFPEIARSVWNTGLDVMQTAIRAGKTIAEAIEVFIQHLKSEKVKFDEIKVRSYWSEQAKTDRPMQMATPEGSPERFPVENAEEIQMRRSAARATESPDIPQEVRTRIAEAPESFYPTQKTPDVAALVSGMSDAELSSVQIHSNIYVAARLEQANRFFKSGNNEAAYDVFVALTREGTNFGQLVNQFKLLKGVNPQSVVDLVNAGLRKAGRDPLKESQREKVRTKAQESIRKNRELEKAKDDWRKDPTDENATTAQRALNEADKADLEVQRLIHQYQHRSIAALLKAIIQGNTLTPISQFANFVGNISGLPFRQANRGGAAVIDIIDSYLRSRPREIAVHPVHGTSAASKGAWEGLKQIPAILRWGPGNVVKGESRAGLHPIQAMVNLLSKTPDVPTVGGRVPFMDRVGMALESTFAVPAEIMLRGLSVGDIAPKLAARSRILSEAFQLKKVPQSQWAFAQKFPELFLDRETLSRVENEMQRAVFQQSSTALNYFNRLLKEKGGDTADLAASMAGAIYRLTPWNVTKEILSWNPLVALGQTAFEAKRGNIRGAEMAASRFVLGSAVTAAGYWLYHKGILSPSLDQPDEEQRARILAQEVMPPNHVNISALRRTFQRYSKGQTPSKEDFGYRAGDETKDIFRSGFIGGSMLYMVANIGRDFEKKKMDQSENMVASLLQDSVLQQMRFGIQQTMLKGTAAALDAILKGDIDSYINSIMGTALSIPIPNSFTAVSRTMREYQVDMKEPEFKERVKNLVKTRLGFLGLDDYMPLKRDLWGRPMKETPEGSNALIYQLFDVTKGRQVTSDPVALELYRLWRKTADPSVIPSIPSRRLTVRNQSYQLNSKQYERLSELVGKHRLDVVQLIVTNPNFQSFTDEQRIALLQRVYERGSQNGRLLFLNEQGKNLESQPKRAGFEAQ